MSVTKYAMPWKVSPGPWSGNTAESINQLFERLYKAVRLGADALDGIGSLANGLDVIVPSAGDMITCLVGGTFVRLPIVATAQRVITNNGGVPTWALLDLATGVTGLLPLANLVNATTTQRLLGRNSAGSGVWEEVTFAQLLTWGTIAAANFTFTNTQRVLGRNTAAGGTGEEVTLTQLLDWIGSAAQGDILFRDAASWARLAAGTAGKILTTAGAGANPSWVTAGGATIGVGAFYTGSGNPQGSVSAAIGAQYIDTTSGYQYRKIGGASTAYGWYLDLPNAGIGLGGPYGFALIPSGLRAATGSSIFNGYGYFVTAVADAVDYFTPSGVTTYSNVFVAGNFFKTMTCAATSGTNMYLAGTTNPHQPLDGNLDLVFEFRTGSDITSVRFWAGISNSVITSSDTFATAGAGALMIRYSTGVPDAGWIGQTSKNGAAAHSETASLGAIAANTTYRLRIRWVSNVAYFSVNDGTEVSLATNVPPTGSTYFLTCGLTTLANVAKSFGVRGISGWQG